MSDLHDFKRTALATGSDVDVGYIDDESVIYYSTIISDHAAIIRPDLDDVADRVCEAASVAKRRVRAGHDPRAVWTEFRGALAQAFDKAEREMEGHPHVSF